MGGVVGGVLCLAAMITIVAVLLVIVAVVKFRGRQDNTEDTPPTDRINHNTLTEDTPSTDRINHNTLTEGTPSTDGINHNTLTEDTSPTDRINLNTLTEGMPSTDKINHNTLIEDTPSTDGINHNTLTEDTPSTDGINHITLTEDTPPTDEINLNTLTEGTPSTHTVKSSQAEQQGDLRANVMYSVKTWETVKWREITFKVLSVKRDSELEEFVVVEHQLNFKRGCAYYEFTHEEENINENQEVMLFDRVSSHGIMYLIVCEHDRQDSCNCELHYEHMIRLI